MSADKQKKKIGAEPINSRVDFVLVFSVDNANPNGDPGYDNRPRTDAYTGIGYVTDVCIKRKIRNRIEMLRDSEESEELKDSLDIWVRSGTYLRETITDAIKEIQGEKEYKKIDKKDDKGLEHYERRRICEKFFDIRAFGGVLTSDSESGEEDDETDNSQIKKRGGDKVKSKVSQIRGPVSIQYAKSVAPIVVENDQITRVCPTKFDEKKPDKRMGMGRKKRVPFAVYITKGSVSARLAEGDKGTGFSDNDLKLLKEALETLFVGDESVARPIGTMIVQKLVFFSHTSKDGDESVHKTLDRVKVTLDEKILTDKYSNNPLKVRDMTPYNIYVDIAGLNAKIKMDELI